MIWNQNFHAAQMYFTDSIIFEISNDSIYYLVKVQTVPSQCLCVSSHSFINFELSRLNVRELRKF